jgi:hypothetical protein
VLAVLAPNRRKRTMNGHKATTSITLAELMERAEWPISDIEAVAATLRMIADSINDQHDAATIRRGLKATADKVFTLAVKRKKARDKALKAPNIRLFP